MGSLTNPEIIRARESRSTLNPAQLSLWSVLKARQLGGWKFTRQMPIGPYFADFVCRERCVVIEVDGSHHLERARCDRARDEYMLAAGYSVYRVPTGSVLKDRVAVCASILAVLENRIEDFVEAPALKFQRSFVVPTRRGFNSPGATRQHAPLRDMKQP
jgi:very-short-patch-repair endonuclease